LPDADGKSVLFFLFFHSPISLSLQGTSRPEKKRKKRDFQEGTKREGEEKGEGSVGVTHYLYFTSSLNILSAGRRERAR